jgi:hypothetical protein
MIGGRDAGSIPLLRIGKLLAEIPHALIGGHAVNAWTEPRLTMDIDLIVDADRSSLSRIESLLAADRLVKGVEHGASGALLPDLLQLTSPNGRIVVELQIAKTPFQREVIQRAHRLAGGLCVAIPEDVIVLKMIANRDKDYRDLLDLCALPGLDWSYIEHWARAFDVHSRVAYYRERVERE